MANQYSDRSPRTVDSYATGDASEAQYQPIDQRFLASDTRANALARQGDMAGLNTYLHTLGRRLPNGNEGTYFNVRTGKIERTTPPWYRDPALIGAVALPAAAVAAPGLLGLEAAGASGASTAGAVGTSGTAAALGPSTGTALADTAAIAGGSTVPGSLAALTPAELAAAGGGGAAGAAGATTALGPSTPESMAATQAIAQGSEVPPMLSNAGLSGSRVASALLSPSILSAGIGTAGQLIGAHMASSGATEAAKIQAAYLEKALAYEKQRDAYQQQLEASRYGNIQQHLGPYMQLGESAAARIQKLLGGGAMPSLPAPSVPTAPPAPYYQRGPGTPGGPPNGTAIPR